MNSTVEQARDDPIMKVRGNFRVGERSKPRSNISVPNRGGKMIARTPVHESINWMMIGNRGDLRTDAGRTEMRAIDNLHIDEGIGEGLVEHPSSTN